MPYAERLQVVWKRTEVGHTEDVLVCTIHFSTPSDGPLGDTIRGSVETAFSTFWQEYSLAVHTSVALDQYRWYDQQVWPTKSPLLRATDITDVPGSDPSSAMPDQVSMSVTLQVPTRRRWGRFYLPGPTVTVLVPATGRYTTAFVDATATQAHAFLNAARTAGALPVVWSPKGGVGPPAFAAGEYQQVDGVRCDDIPDIIRSRREQSAPYRRIFTLP